MGKRIALLAEEIYEDLELWYPYLRLLEAGHEVTVVGPQATTYKSKHGYPVEATLKSSEARGADFDGVIVPGGFAPDRMRRDDELLRFVREVYQAGKPTGAICHAGWVLVSAGILKGKRMTCVRAIRDDVVNAGATYVDEPVVVDGNLITSRVPSDLPAFCRAYLAKLG